MGDDNKYLIEKMDKIHDDIGEIKVTLAKQEISISEHIKRTSVAEDRIEMLKSDLDPIKIQLAKNKAIKETIIFFLKISPILSGLGIAIFKFLSNSLK